MRAIKHFLFLVAFLAAWAFGGKKLQQYNAQRDAAAAEQRAARAEADRQQALQAQIFAQNQDREKAVAARAQAAADAESARAWGRSKVVLAEKFDARGKRTSTTTTDMATVDYIRWRDHPLTRKQHQEILDRSGPATTSHR